jgi:hypothetical protein
MQFHPIPGQQMKTPTHHITNLEAASPAWDHPPSMLIFNLDTQDFWSILEVPAVAGSMIDSLT